MGETDERETAKIYDFSAFRRSRAARPVGAEAKPVRVPGIGGGAWYHEAAIRDEDRPRRP